MSEIENSTLVESAIEMEPLEQETAVTVDSNVEATPASVSNQEAMTALTLSRVKKQSKQFENLTRLLAQLPAQIRTFEKRQSKQARQLSQQVRLIQAQVKQVQKQISRIRVPSAGPKKRRAAKKSRKSKAKRR